jgi:hypothetical protein
MNAFAMLIEAKDLTTAVAKTKRYRVINPLGEDPSPPSRFGMTVL